MKNIYVLLSLSLAVVSCSKYGISAKNQIIPEGKKEFALTSKIVTDSVEVYDSISVSKNLYAYFSAKALLFPKIKDKTFLDSIYSGAGIQLDAYSKESISNELVRQKKKYFAETLKDATLFPIEYEQTWEENSYMGVLSQKNGLLTLSYGNDGFSGGAHGYSNVFFKNFDLKKNKTVELEDIFNNFSEMDWNGILANHFDNDDQKEMLLVDKIPVNRNFYFNQKEITFVYNHYEITAYAAGVVEITIPFSELKNNLKPEFIKRYGIK